MMPKKMIILLFPIMLFALTLTNITNAADPTLVGRWRFDETSGTIAADSSGNGNHGTIVGNPQWVVGKINGALEFDGNGDYVNCGNSPVLQVQDQITLACWFKVTRFTRNWATILSMGDNSYRLSRGESNYSMHLGLNGTASMPWPWFDGKKRVDDDQWHHIAGVYDGAEGRIYIDGVLDNSQAATGQINASAFPLYIGENAQATGRFWNGLIDDVRIYSRALSEEEIQIVMTGVDDRPELASGPYPADKAIDVPRDVILSWTPGKFADTHDVYFGTSFDDVNDASRTNQLNVLASEAQHPDTYNPGRLDFDQKFYWRIDEVNTPPDSTIYAGKVWSFKVESVAYPVPAESIIATASSQVPGQGPEQTINSSGLTNDQHSVKIEDMWLTAAGDPVPWIQYQFDKLYKLHEMFVWNYNGPFILSGRGLQNVVVEYSTDANSWGRLDQVSKFEKATASTGYTYNNIVDFNGVTAKYVKITASSNWNTMFNQFGLSEVRFMYIPVRAKEPVPEDGATDVAIDAVLSWRAGRDAAEHNLYISTEKQAVIDRTAPVITLADAGYAPLSLGLENIYYWRVDEVNNFEPTPLWESDVWSFTTQQYLVVDDFESYNEVPADQEGSNLVYETWIDGYVDPPAVRTNGSTIGYASGASMEPDTVHSGDQSVPLLYNNTSLSISEVTVDPGKLAVGRDWTVGSPKMLVLWIYGDPNNPAMDRMYLKVNTAKVLFDGNISQAQWRQFPVDLASLGISLSNVTQLAIGIERIGTTGGSGTVFIDDIRLYKTAPAE